MKARDASDGFALLCGALAAALIESAEKHELLIDEADVRRAFGLLRELERRHRRAGSSGVPGRKIH